MRLTGKRSVVGVLTLFISGCYSGLDAGDPGQADSGDTDGSGQDGSGGDDPSGGDGGDGGSGGGDPGGEPLCEQPQAGPTSLLRITASQYDNTIRDLLGLEANAVTEFVPDERVGPFKSNAIAPVGNLQVEQYMAAAESLADEATSDLSTLVPCQLPQSAEDESTCAESFVSDFGKRAYRRPLASDEQAALMEVYQEGYAQDGFENGIRLVVSAVLQSPWFLYHHELAQEDAPTTELALLDGYSIASRMSYFLWNTMPDEELFAAAESGSLETEEGLDAQVDRMLGDPRAAESVANFHVQWLGVDEIGTLEKNADYYPDFNPDLAQAMRAETADFATYVVLEGDGLLDTLLTGDFTVTDDPALAALYGATIPEDHASGDPIALDPGQRAGLLTQASFLAVQAHADQSSPVHRGVAIRENILCQPLPPPPADADDVLDSPDPNSTTRERLEQHREDPACSGCHQLIDGLGLGLENYDGVGRFRELDGNNPVDASGDILGTDVDQVFDGGVELAGILAQSDVVRECVSTQWVRFALGRNEAEADYCTIASLQEEFAASNYDVRALLRGIVLSDSFRYRIAAPADGEA